MAEVERSYDGLRDVILKEHVLSTYRRESLVWRRDTSRRAQRMDVLKILTDGKAGGGSTGKDDTHRPGQALSMGLAGRRGPSSFYNCKCLGHFARDCFKGRKTQVNTIARKTCETEASCSPANLAFATVNGEGATLLYNTGCSVSALVDKKYVKPGDYIGEVIEVQYANSACDSLPVAVIDFDLPYMKGKAGASCLEGLLHDVILGCRYVFPQPNPETSTSKRMSAIETRSQSRQTKPKPMQVTSTPVSNELSVELRKLLQEDITLVQVHKYAAERIETLE
ncbi:hypothetical protein CHS0354_031672 [Potamilus streckersoni]|uniref:Uncharacterized protein n=1 Tax=Potamilus streckersoni TaxID=2493646 RepID=A0AAE0W1J7_9BIVA|nr:hypothetical protein CHS0354_031672 [Potamilus streckersoni]